MTLGQRSDVASLEAVNKELGLDQPLQIQYIRYLNDISPLSVHVDDSANKAKYAYTRLFSVGENQYLVVKKPYLRRSYQSKQTVNAILAGALPGTVILALSAMLLATAFGLF